MPPHLRKGAFRPPDKLIALLRDTAVMESKTVREKHQNGEDRPDSPLLILPIRHVMGISH